MIDDTILWLTVPEVAKKLDVSRATVYRLVTRGTLPAFRLGGRLRFRAEDLDAAFQPVPVPTPTKPAA